MRCLEMHLTCFLVQLGIFPHLLEVHSKQSHHTIMDSNIKDFMIHEPQEITRLFHLRERFIIVSHESVLHSYSIVVIKNSFSFRKLRRCEQYLSRYFSQTDDI